MVFYVPLPVYGTLGAPENYDLPRVIEARMMTPQNPFGLNPKQPIAPQPAAAQPQQGAGGQVYQQGPTQIPGPTVGATPHGIQSAVVGPGGQMTQQIYIPNDMVGAIIGKGGAKINEIRQLSGSHMYGPFSFALSSRLMFLVKLTNLQKIVMRGLLLLLEHRIAIRWRCICCIPDLKRRSIGCRGAKEDEGLWRRRFWLWLNKYFGILVVLVVNRIIPRSNFRDHQSSHNDRSQSHAIFQ